LVTKMDRKFKQALTLTVPPEHLQIFMYKNIFYFKDETNMFLFA